MPFTASHIAAVLPVHRILSRAQVFSAAVIGSMVPDFGLLLPITPPHVETHSLTGLFSFCLPVGLIAYLLTLLLIKPAIMQIAPDGAYARLRAADFTAPPRALRGWLLVALAILFGAITHLIWDGFTHENAPGVLMFPVLDNYGPEVHGHALQLYRWAQYGSSVVGLIAVMVALVIWLRHAPAPTPRPVRVLRDAERHFWMALYIILPLLAIVGEIWHIHAPSAPWLPLGWRLGSIATVGMRASVVSLLLVSLILRARLAPLRQASPP